MTGNKTRRPDHVQQYEQLQHSPRKRWHAHDRRHRRFRRFRSGNRSFGGATTQSLLQSSLAATVEALSVEDTTSLTLSGNISGVGGLTKTGAGSAFLSGTNSFGGPLTIQAGSVELDSAAASAGANISIGNPIADQVNAVLAIGKSGMNITNPINTTRDDSGSDSRNAAFVATYTSGNSIRLRQHHAGRRHQKFAAPIGATLTVASLIANGSDGTNTRSDAQCACEHRRRGGTVILSNANTYSGISAIDTGQLILENNTAAGTNTIFVGNGGNTLANSSASLLADTAGLTIANLISTNKSDTGTAERRHRHANRRRDQHQRHCYVFRRNRAQWRRRAGGRQRRNCAGDRRDR